MLYNLKYLRFCTLILATISSTNGLLSLCQGLQIFPPIPVTKIINTDIAGLKLNLTLHGELFNISNINVHEPFLDLNLQGAVNLTLYEMTFDGWYNLSSSFWDAIPLVGAGTIQIHLDQANISMVPKLTAENGYLKMYNLILDLQTGKTNLSLDGLLFDQGLSTLLEAVIHDFVESTLENLHDVIQTEVKNTILQLFSKSPQGINIFQLIEISRKVIGFFY